jgi:oligopeptide/dipeptide ABC transporter ATP-binding protein
MKQVGQQLGEMIRRHSNLSKREALARSIDLLTRVGIPEASRRVRDYPHEFSGGQRQRIMIAMAISCGPRLLIADEPTTALDVTIQAQILDLMLELRLESGMGLLLITHDLGIVARVCERVVVMYAGRVVEDALVADLFRRPRHPYTAALLASIPRIDMPNRATGAIPGAPLRATESIEGCAFRPRCSRAVERCTDLPVLEEIGVRHFAACWLSQDL